MKEDLLKNGRSEARVSKTKLQTEENLASVAQVEEKEVRVDDASNGGAAASNMDDMATRPARLKDVIRLAAPIIVSMVSMSLLGLVDTLFMRWVGSGAQAAIGLGSPLTFSIMSFFLGTLAGVTTFVSQYFGAKKYGESGKLLWHSVGIALIFGVLTIIVVIPLVWQLLVFMQTNGEIIDDAFRYMKVRLLAAPIVYASFAFVSFLRGIGDMKTPAITALVTVAANIPLTYIFTFGLGPIPAYGVTGAAIGTILSQLIELLCFMKVVLNKKHGMQYKTRQWYKPELSVLKAFFAVSLPIGISWAIEHVGWAAFGLFIGSLDKESAAAHAIVQVFMNLVFMPGLAISIAATTLVGQFMGAGNVKSAEKSAYYSIWICLGFLLGIGAIIFVCRYWIAEGFSTDAKVIQICANLFCFGIAYQVFDGIGVPSMGALRGAGDTRFPMLLMFLCMWGLMIPLVYLFGRYLGYGVYGAWGAMCISCMMMGLGSFGRFRRGLWKSMGVIHRTEN